MLIERFEIEDRVKVGDLEVGDMFFFGHKRNTVFMLVAEPATEGHTSSIMLSGEEVGGMYKLVVDELVYKINCKLMEVR